VTTENTSEAPRSASASVAAARVQASRAFVQRLARARVVELQVVKRDGTTGRAEVFREDGTHLAEADQCDRRSLLCSFVSHPVSSFCGSFM
jgi:hypothetical protein